MSNFPEIGYTPANLRFLIESKGWTQAQAAALLSVADNTLRQWLIPVDLKSHRDMPHKTWLKLLEIKEPA
ncbi:MAG TPA: helix-turn-helix transcriptional regulator [Agitococcus sp.]|nr:helix-turn-helix transcriptional regulator [Agitococcus sp.]